MHLFDPQCLQCLHRGFGGLDRRDTGNTMLNGSCANSPLIGSSAFPTRRVQDQIYRLVLHVVDQVGVSFDNFFNPFHGYLICLDMLGGPLGCNDLVAELMKSTGDSRGTGLVSRRNGYKHAPRLWQNNACR